MLTVYLVAAPRVGTSEIITFLLDAYNRNARLRRRVGYMGKYSDGRAAASGGGTNHHPGPSQHLPINGWKACTSD